jgi:aryl-alcohol dehydrogenase-like predicted oxidoreductase
MRQLALKIDDRAKAIVLEVAAIAKEIGRSSAQVALSWLRHRATPVIPIIGARKIEQLKDNISSLEVQLSTDQLARLNEVSKIEMGFPHDFFDREMVRAVAFGGMKDAIDVA